jgi:hypothetical protein
MSSLTNETPLASCGYCGRANPDRLSACAGCGTQLAGDLPQKEDSSLQDKSKALALFLAVLLGPLGLFYLRAWTPAVVIIGLALPFRLTQSGGLWLPTIVRLVCIAVVCYLFSDPEETVEPGRDANSLLDQAARLENIDRAQAIAAYEEIIRLHPGTPASRESERNIQTLRKHV